MKALALVAIAVVGVLTACSERPQNKQQGRSAVDRVRRPGETVAFAPGYEQRQKEEYETRLEAILNGYLRSIDELKSQARTHGTNNNAEWEPDLTALEVKAEAVSKILERLRATNLESWQDLKSGIHAALDDLESTYEKTVVRLGELRNPALSLPGAGQEVQTRGSERAVPIAVKSEKK
jgi:hypothetical protein